MRSLARRIALATALITTVSPVRAVDHVIEFRCNREGGRPRFEISPRLVTLVAGSDRIVFRTLGYDESLPCAVEANSPTLDVNLWETHEGVFLWYYGSESIQGPFCALGPRNYIVQLRGSHGEINGEIGPGTIEVLPPTDEVFVATIGIFAEPEALTCALPGSPGTHRAYVCALLEAAAGGALSSAEFRILGFPATWNVTFTPGPSIEWSEGDPLGAGVRVKNRGCTSEPEGIVILYEIVYEVPAPGAQEMVEIYPGHFPGRARPIVKTCFEQSVREGCAQGGRAWVGGDADACVVGVKGITWTRVRSLYR